MPEAGEVEQFASHAESARAISRRLPACPMIPGRFFREQPPPPPPTGELKNTFLSLLVAAAENEAVELMITLSREFGTRVHIVHHSSADALPMLAAAKAEGLKITAETCPHYLSFAAEDIPDGATEFKCCPPIRERENREQLWSALASSTIDMIVSDHSPCPPEMKLREAGDFLAAWGGISSLQLRLPIMWTAHNVVATRSSRTSPMVCSSDSRTCGGGGRKGLIKSGAMRFLSFGIR